MLIISRFGLRRCLAVAMTSPIFSLRPGWRLCAKVSERLPIASSGSGRIEAIRIRLRCVCVTGSQTFDLKIASLAIPANASRPKPWPNRSCPEG